MVIQDSRCALKGVKLLAHDGVLIPCLNCPNVDGDLFLSVQEMFLRLVKLLWVTLRVGRTFPPSDCYPQSLIFLCTLPLSAQLRVVVQSCSLQT